ncbi:PAS-domain containing protein [Ruegeria sp. HKCCD8929]|uniref:hybrid sensor histidine kinase/response regulator n=1 Tax=Ruegeria sp. HKCCD8929 TaxID=2683006 RepID=UPI0014887D47|nr:PAS-domain containing protein [Ruegeria sp. HKCCD8929]
MHTNAPPVPILRPNDDQPRQIKKLQRIVEVLMHRVEASGEDGFNSYAHFQTAVALEAQVQARTRDLEEAVTLLNQSRARLAEAMAEAETARADLSNALEAVREGFALFAPDGRLIMSNRRFARMLPDVVGHIKPGLPLDDYTRRVSESSDLVLPGDASAEDWRRDRLRRLRQFHADFVVELKGDRWIQVSQQRTPNGGTAILQTEVTDMVRLERRQRDKLLDNQARLIRATLDHINQGICIFDAEDRLAAWNDQFFALMTPPMELMRTGTGFNRLVDHFNTAHAFRSLDAPQAVVDWVANRGNREPLRVEFQRDDDTILDVFSDMTPDGGFVICFTDVTQERAITTALHEVNETLELRVKERTAEMQKARDAAERANNSKSRFLAAVSHDLLQPLNAAKLFLSTLEETEMNELQTDVTARVKSAFDSVETILGALLDISKLDAGTSATISIFPLSRLLAPLREEFQAIAAEKGLNFHVVDCGLEVESDASYLRRIIQNLASNAVAYTTSGKVLVGARRAGEELRIEVYDTGPGIPTDQQERVFHEFQRIQRQDATPGMGLGLTIVRRACDLLGHRLTMESKEGVGTRFAVHVPFRNPGPDSRAQQGLRAFTANTSLTGMIPLIIENEAEVRLGMMTLLDSWGASPIEAANLAEADALIQEFGAVPDVILADYHLDEGESGLHAIRMLRNVNGPIPAALITANRSERLSARAKAENVLLLYKPLQPTRLRTYLNALRRPA